MVPVWNMLSSEANCLAYHQEFCVCKCIRPASPLEQKTAYDVPRASAGHHGMSCTTREGRPSCHERPCLSDAWLSCAGRSESSAITDSFGLGFTAPHQSLCAVQYSRSRFRFKNGNRNSRTIVTTVYVAAWEGRRVRSWTKEARTKTLASILGLAAGLTA